mgnify:CR=1 FL=1
MAKEEKLRCEIEDKYKWDLTKIYKFDTAKWLIDEKLDENKTGQKILFIFKLKGLEEVYKQEGSHRGDELVKEMMSQYEVYVFEADKMTQGFVGLNDKYIEGIFVSDEMQSCGIGKLLLDYVKDKKVSLRLNVYQKNARAISFYQREGFIIEGEGLDEATGEKEYTMLWKQNRNRNFYKELIQKAGAETELVYMKASKELLKKRLYKRNQVLNANSPFVITDEILEHHYHAFQEPWGEGEKVILQK